MSSVVLCSALVPIEVTVQRLAKLVGESVKGLDDKQFSGEDVKIKYLLHKYAYEEKSTEVNPFVKNGGVLRRPILMKKQEKLRFPFIKPIKSREANIPYSHKPRVFLERFENSNSSVNQAYDYSSNISNIFHENSRSKLIDEHKHYPRDRLVRSVENSRTEKNENSSAFSLRSSSSRREIFKQIDGTSFLQARPSVKLPPISQPKKKMLPYLLLT